MSEKCCEVTASVKRFAFFGVAVSTVATLTAIIAVPMLCIYMQNVQSGLQDDLTFCRSRNDGLKTEYNKLVAVRQAAVSGRSYILVFHFVLIFLPDRVEQKY